MPRIGETIDGFHLEEAIGVGGMGAVYRARDTRLDRQVALKLLPPEQAEDPEVVLRFYQEGRSAARLDHENIARVYTIGHDGRYHYIAFEYIEGTTLRQRVERQGALEPGEAINYTLQIADALVHASERGVVHRDVKPSNIIITPGGRAKLVDMGLARRFERGVDDGLTQSGMTLGTFDYISPEQARDPRNVDVRSDLYSLGCTLFHMLTNRPPFPEGTVLQKLIQHQEEPPPDVRALNPAVPKDLANILVKLMAKDRERRYQSPELLVRDLLCVAGSLGLRSVSPEGLVWLASDSPRPWERHLVWAFPAVALAAVVGGLLWSGRDKSASIPIASGAAEARATPTRRSSATENPVAVVPEAASAAASGDKAVMASRTSAPSDQAGTREIVVGSTEDLSAVLAAAPPRSLILLADAGPYFLSPGRNLGGDRLVRKEFTLKASEGVRPVLRLARAFPGVTAEPTALLDFVGGQIVLDGLEFEADLAGAPAKFAAVRVEDTSLSMSRCVFRGQQPVPGGSVEEPSQAAGLEVRSSSTSDEEPRRLEARPPAVTLDRCHLEGFPTGVLGVGEIDISLRDCTIAATGPAAWLRHPNSEAECDTELRLRHVSILASETPVFRFDGGDPRVRVEDCVVAAPARRSATLASTDLAGPIRWRGRDNLYAGIKAFQVFRNSTSTSDPLLSLGDWEDAGVFPREVGSVDSEVSAWEAPDPRDKLERERGAPSRAFRLAPIDLGLASDVGARLALFGPKPAAGELARADPAGTQRNPALERPSPVAAEEGNPVPSARSEPTFQGGFPAEPPDPPRMDETIGMGEDSHRNAAAAPPQISKSADEPRARGSEPIVPERMEDLPEMPVLPPSVREPAGIDSAPSRGAGEALRTTAEPSPESRRASSPNESKHAATEAAVEPLSTAPVGQSTEVIRTTADLKRALMEKGRAGGTLTIAAGVELRLDHLKLQSSGPLKLVGAPGESRPRIIAEPSGLPDSGPEVNACFLELTRESLSVEGIDLLVPAENPTRSRQKSLFYLRSGAALNLVNCSVTIEGEDNPTSLLMLSSDENEEARRSPDVLNSSVTVKVKDSYLRTSGDLAEAKSGLKLNLDIENSLLVTGGSVLHARGVPQGRTPERLDLSLRQVTAFMKGGLVHLESAFSEPELPITEIHVRDTVLSLGQSSTPLLRVDGQDGAFPLGDRVVWDGQGVFYHQIAIYRRDQSTQVGSVPTLYDRASWVVAVGTREVAAFHGDVKFLAPRPLDRPPWMAVLDDAKLAPGSPAAKAGPNLTRIPSPPLAR